MHTNHIHTPGRLRTALTFTAGIAATIVAGITLSTTIAGAAVPGDDERSTFVPITPCRLMDTRPGDDNVGPRATPLGEDETHVQQVTGPNGHCDVPAGATAIALNATAIRPTATSYLTFFPSGADVPLSSNLNLAPGQPPTPNKVDVRLSATGAIGIFNAFGQVHVAVDVMGYYVAAPHPFATTAHHDGSALSGTPSRIVSVVVTPPTHGALVVTSTTHLGTLGGGRADCSINDSVAMDDDHRQVFDPDGGEQGTIAGSRTFAVTGGEQITVGLVCVLASGAIGVNEADLTALFVPSLVPQPVTSVA